MIRQVTVGCAERGLLLLRLRDEMRMTTAAYQARARPRGARRTSAEGQRTAGSPAGGQRMQYTPELAGQRTSPAMTSPLRHAPQCRRSSLPPAPPFVSQAACKVLLRGCAGQADTQAAAPLAAVTPQALYESSLAFGLRKVVQAEDGKEALAARAAAAEAQAAQLRDRARHACMRPYFANS